MSNKQHTKLWFSLFTKEDYVSDEPGYVDCSAVVGISNLEANYKTIRDELDQYLSKNKLQGHFNTTMVDKAESWKVRSLRVWDVEMYEIQKHFPKTMALIDAVPGVVGISFNLLEAQSKIKPHSGDTNGIIRCHLGLKIPAGAPHCALKVKGEIRGWEEGKVLSFIDAYPHEAWNLCDDYRILILFDILKPELKNKRSEICGTVLSSLYVQRLGNIWPGLYNVNRSAFKFILWPLITFLRMSIPVRNAMKS
ncbi:MAG: aspartyl/asparaginyl beta-hydroxylase domain-containing protein [Bacteroidia bacterium]